MSENFVIKKRRRHQKVIKVEENIKSGLPEYLLNPPRNPDDVEKLENNHTRELVCSFGVAKEILGSSFRPKESNLAVGKIKL